MTSCKLENFFELHASELRPPNSEGYNSGERDWSVLDKSSTVSIPERTHIKADLKCVPKEPSGGGSGVAPSPVSAVAASASEPSSTAAASKAPKRKMGMAQYLANKRRKEVEQVKSAAATKFAASPTVSHENGEEKVQVAIITLVIVYKGQHSV